MNFAVRLIGRHARRQSRLVRAVQAKRGAIARIIGWCGNMAGRSAGKADMENEQIGGEPARRPAPTPLVAVICPRHARPLLRIYHVAAERQSSFNI